MRKNTCVKYETTHLYNKNRLSREYGGICLLIIKIAVVEDLKYYRDVTI